MNDVVAAVATANQKVIDYHVMSKFCKGYTIWDKKKGTLEYDQWKEKHQCAINHKQSSGAMEAAGAITIFQSSIEKHKLRYSHYIGDGDSESFRKVVDSKPYGNELDIGKLECIGHYQKRFGNRIHKKRLQLKGKILSDGKKIIGRGRLTDKAINTMQNYFGMAIRQNKGKLYEMKKAIGTVLWHCSDIHDEEIRHKFCPKSINSWCKWQSDKITGDNKYKTKLNLPVSIKEEIEPIFKDLSSDDILSKCLHGQTQNANEAFNQIIWTKCPKQQFASRKTLERATHSAVISYNDRFSSLKKVFSKLSVPHGNYF